MFSVSYVAIPREELTRHEEIQGLNPQYSYVEDHSRGQSRYKCTIKYSIDGGPRRVDSGGYHATKEAAMKMAELQLPRLPLSRGGITRDYKAELRHYATKEAATKMAELQLPRLPLSRGGITRDYKAELRHFYVHTRTISEPRISYTTKEVSRRGYQSTVYAPEMGSVKGEYCTTRQRAESSAALTMLMEIKKHL